MTLSIPIFNPNAGRLGRLLESLSAPGPCSAAPPTSTQRTGMRDVCSSREPLPMTMEVARKRGWDELDVVFVSGDAYIDHPSFAMAILGRVLEAAGFQVGIVSQPDWRKVDDWRRFG